MRFAVLAGLLASMLPAAFAATPDLQLDSGRFLAKYPGPIVGFSLLDDPRGRAWSASGQRESGVAPTYGAGSELPLRRATLDFDWTFPFFEADAVPGVSSRLWTARAVLGVADVATRGPLGAAAEDGGAASSQSGLHDVDLAFGPVLIGSADWRTRTRTPLSVILLGELRLPVGARDPNAPNHAGDGVFAWGARLGGHWQPESALLRGLRLDAGVRLRWYGHQSEPAFNAQEPARPGRDLEFDATLARRIWKQVHAQVSYHHREGAANRYRGIRQTANPPEADPLNVSFPDPAEVRDGGSRAQRLQLGLGAFVTPRLWLGMAWTRPLAGRSGAFEVPYLQQGQDCEATGTCLPRANGRDAIDGLGSARSFASDSWQLTLRWQPRQGGSDR